MTFVARSKTVGAGEFKPGLLVSERGGQPTDLRMTSIAPIPERIHVRIGVAGDALRLFRTNRGLGVMARGAGELVVASS